MMPQHQGAQRLIVNRLLGIARNGNGLPVASRMEWGVDLAGTSAVVSRSTLKVIFDAAGVPAPI